MREKIAEARAKIPLIWNGKKALLARHGLLDAEQYDGGRGPSR